MTSHELAGRRIERSSRDIRPFGFRHDSIPKCLGIVPVIERTTSTSQLREAPAGNIGVGGRAHGLVLGRDSQ